MKITSSKFCENNLFKDIFTYLPNFFHFFCDNMGRISVSSKICIFIFEYIKKCTNPSKHYLDHDNLWFVY